MHLGTAALAAAGTMLAALSPAAAHVVFDPAEGKAGRYHAAQLRVSHGCGASPTRSIRVEIPQGVVSARPQPKAGWTLRIETEKLAVPITSEGGATITERVSAISWTGDLPPDQFEQFGIMMKLPARGGPLYFPTRQRCETGENAWIEQPSAPERWHDMPAPAPMLIVTGGAAPEGHDDHAGH